MILDIRGFIAREQPYWEELEALLDEAPTRSGMPVEELQRLHYLYERATSDLARLAVFTSERRTHQHLEALVARAYGEIHDVGRVSARGRFVTWFTRGFPIAFRRHHKAFMLSLAVTFLGSLFGSVAHLMDDEAKRVIMPPQFAAHLGDPDDRVKREIEERGRGIKGNEASFSAYLMKNNISVSIKALAFSMTYGIGTLVMLFYNGIILGLISCDYVLAGHSVFLMAWLLPHGAIEIPAILIAGQAGLVVASALIGWGSRAPLRVRLRAVSGDVSRLIGGVAVMLVWAGIIEAFMSQYHEPVLPASVKIAFGVLELAALIGFLALVGKKYENEQSSPAYN